MSSLRPILYTFLLAIRILIVSARSVENVFSISQTCFSNCHNFYFLQVGVVSYRLFSPSSYRTVRIVPTMGLLSLSGIPRLPPHSSMTPSHRSPPLVKWVYLIQWTYKRKKKKKKKEMKKTRRTASARSPLRGFPGVRVQA
jgi:hypothetical protein